MWQIHIWKKNVCSRRDLTELNLLSHNVLIGLTLSFYKKAWDYKETY